jgi:DNA processing protein
MNEEEYIYSIALTQVSGVGAVWAKHLLKATGSAVSIFKDKEELLHLIPEIPASIKSALNDPNAVTRAEKEYEFILKNNIQCLTIKDEAYPVRLRECEDAPAVLFYKGTADLNVPRVISMVGTRNATDYGIRICNRFLEELQPLCPDVLVVSGLAYGIDIHTHRAAIANQLLTVGILAHGLDRIYPSEHRKTAVDMLERGGLLTEFLTETIPDKYNFVSRNRIVAGISDATIVVESAKKGGSLITAEIAGGYQRECFAFPGRITDEYSQGCNSLIHDNKATLIQSAEEFVQVIGWNAQSHKTQNVQRKLFPDLSDDEKRIVSLLDKQGGMQINQLVVTSDISIQKMNALLFELEMKGVLRALAGGMYRLL